MENMAKLTKQKKVAASRANRTETVSIRLDRETRYIAELAARKTRRALSGYIEWVVAQSFDKIEMQPRGITAEKRLLKDEVHFLWDSCEADRFMLLGALYPDLMTFDEQRLWKVFEVAVPLLFCGLTTNIKQQQVSVIGMTYAAFYKSHVAPVASSVCKEVSRVLDENLNEGDDEYNKIIDKVRAAFEPVYQLCLKTFASDIKLRENGHAEQDNQNSNP